MAGVGGAAVYAARIDHGAHGDEQPLDRAPRFVFGQAAEPAVAGEFGGGMDGGLDRLVSGLVIAGDVGEARGEPAAPPARSEEHTSELQSLMRISYAVFCLKKKKKNTNKPD